MEQSKVSSQVNSEPAQVPKTTAELVAEIYHVSPSTVKRAAEFTNAVDVITENTQNIDRDIRDKILNEEIGMSIKEIVALAEEDLDKQQRRISRALKDMKSGIKPKPEKPEKKEKSPEEKRTFRFLNFLRELEYLTNEQLDRLSQEIAEIKDGRSIPEDLFEAPKQPQEQTSPEATVTDEPKPQGEQTETAEPKVSEESEATTEEEESEESESEESEE